jgi:hypothetical protein
MRSLAEAQFSESGIRDPMIAMIQRLRAAGIVGARYVPGGIKEDGAPPTQSIVIFDERAPVLLTDQSGNLMQERRGQFSPDTNTVTLFEQSDVTTMLHEGAHWYLETLFRMATSENPHPFVTEQYNAILAWGKAGPDFQMYDAAGRLTAEGRELHETWAETFEVYIQTGKAPTSALRDTFRAFKTWITALWKRMYGGGQPARANLNPEVIAIMDRMLAVDEEIEAEVAGIMVGAQAQAKALLDAKVITQAQYDKALANLDEAREKAKEDFGARVMADKMREDEAWWNTEKRRVRGDVVRELDRSPIGRALSWLGYGQWKGDVPVGETEQQDDGAEFYQSIRAATRMPMPEVDAWVRANVTASESQLGADTLTVIKFPLTEDPGAPEVMLSIRLKERSNRRDQGRADVNLFLDNQMADALENVEDPVQRATMAKIMFAKTVMVMRQYGQEYDVKAFNFTAAESQAEGTNAKSREDLYRFMLSSLSMPGYSAYEIESQTSIVNRDEDGAKSANPMLGMAGFVIIKDGVNVEDFAKNEILRGSQRGGDAGEVVTVARATPLGRRDTGDGSGRGRRGTGAADTGGVVDNTFGQALPRDLIRSAAGRSIPSAPRIPDKAALTEQLGVQIGIAEALLADNDSPELAGAVMRLRALVEQAGRLPVNEWLGAWVGNLEALARVLDGISPPVAASVRTALQSPEGRQAALVLEDRGVRVLQPEQLGDPPMLLVNEAAYEKVDNSLGQEAPPKYRPVETVASADGSFEFARNRDLKVGMQDRVQRAADDNDADLLDEDYLVRMTERDARSALVGNSNAVGWYDEKVRKAIAALTLLHPELETDAEARFAFTWALAVTSNGLKVDKNFELAETVYSAWKASSESGGARRMPTNVGIGTAAKAINKSLGLYNTLVEKHGVQVVLDFMTARQTVKQVQAFTGENVSGENLTTEVFGAAALGPKIGNGFFMNLYGEFGQLTMDRWLMRTWGRWSATLITDYSTQARESRKKLGALLKLLSPTDKRALEKIIRRPIKLREIDEVGLALQRASQKPALRAEMNKLGIFMGAEPQELTDILGPAPKGDARESVGAEIRKRGNALAKYLDGQKEQPSGPPERKKIRAVFARALENMKKDYPALTMADLQALLWYPEKRLYDTAKAKEGEETEGYEDDEAPDYANAARNLVVSKGVSEASVRDAYARIDNDVQAARRAGRVERDGARGSRDGGTAGVQGVSSQDNTLGQSAPASPFYSQLQRVIERSATTRAPASQWLGIIRNAPGVKAEEVEWTGVGEWLEAQDGPVTREALAAFLAGNGVQVEEVVRGQGGGTSDAVQRQILPLIERRDELNRELEAIIADPNRVTRSFGQADDIVERDGLFFVGARQYRTRQGAEAAAQARRRQTVTPNDDATDSRIDEIRQERASLESQIADLEQPLEGDQTKWSSYTLPGGENYTELLLTLPERAVEVPRLDTTGWRVETVRNNEWTGQREIRILDAAGAVRGQRSGFRGTDQEALDNVADGNQTTERREESRKVNFKSSHWSEPNVLAHVRFKERTGPNGERVLALEEVQSDWHQAGRERGYKPKGEPPSFEDWYAGNGMALFGEPFDQLDARAQGMARQRWEDATRRGFTGAIPDAPFKNNAWAELVLKRMVRWAADNGFDSVAWIPGNVQNGQLVEDTGDNRGDFYDKILPNIANKLGKKYGARVSDLVMEGAAPPAKSEYFVEGNEEEGYTVQDANNRRTVADGFRYEEDAFTWIGQNEPSPDVTFHSLPLTDALRTAAISEGFPLFQPGDPKGWGETAPPPNLPPMRLDLAETERLYGKEAVAKLPKAIRDRGRDQTSIDSMFAIARATAKTLRRKPPKSLFQFIRSRKARTVEGKTVPVKQWGIRGAADELKAMDRADLINEENGIHIDYMRELAEEAGYLPEGSTVNDMLNAIDREARGEPVYSSQDQNEVLDYQNAEEWANWFDEQGVDINDKDEKALRAKLAKVVTSTAADAVTPDQAAELLGFNTGEELLAALAEIGNRERFIQAETDRRMAAEFGDPYKDGTFAEAARQAAEIEVKARAAEIELEALARAVGESAASKMAKQMAEESLSLMTVKELAGWTKFLDAERRHGRNALAATKKGDMAEAMLHKRRQLVSMHLARAAREKSEALEKTRKDLMSYLTSKGRRDKIARDYLDKIEALLDQYELRVSKQGPGTQRARLSAKQYVEQMIADGREAEIAPEAMLLAEMADAKVWRDLLAEEADYLAGTVKNLAHLGRTKNKLMKAQDKRRFDAVVAELVDTLVAAPSTRKRGKSFSPGMTEDLMTRASQFDAKLTKIQDEFELLDGKEAGPLQTTLLLPIEQADVRKGTMMRGAIKEIRGLWNAVPSRIRQQTLSRRVATPELKLPTAQNMTLMDVVLIGLNWGNDGNRQALMAGYGWEASAVEAVLDRYLTDEHWGFITGVWKLIGSYKAEAFALEKAMTGVEPKSVEGITFTLPSGRVVKGAYYPLKYDAEQENVLSVKQGKLDEKQMLSEMGFSFSKPMTKTGHMISRVGSGGKPVKMSLDVFYEHIENVVHDIAFRPAIIDAFRIIRDPRFTQAYIDAAGKAQYDRLLPWLHSIATNNRARFSSTFAKTMTFFRAGWSASIMGYSFSTATQQLTGYIEAGTEIGGRWVIQGALKSLSMGPASFWREWTFIRDRSEYLANRVAIGKERDIRIVKTTPGIGNSLSPITDNAFIFLSVMDAIVGTAVWRGAYDKAVAGRVNGIAKDEEDAAIAYADRVVQRSLSSGETYALPEIMREGEISALMTMVYSYGSKTYNRQRVRNMKLRQGKIGVTEFTINTLIAFMAVPILAALLAGRLWPDDDEEWEDRGDDIANEVLMNAAGTTPFVRDMVTLLAKPQYGYQLSPVQSTFEQIGVATRSAVEGKTFDSEYQTKQAVMAISTVFRLPGGQLFETGDYLYDLYMGEEDPMEDPADAAREAFIRSER